MTPPDSSAALASPGNSSTVAAPVAGQMIAFPVGRYAIPVGDLTEFGALKETERERIKFLLGLMAQMEQGGVVTTSANLAFQLRHLRGYSAANIRTLYYKWQADGWRGLIRNYTKGGETLPAAFVDHFRALCERNARSITQAINALKRSWYAGEAIPGYGTWRDWFFATWPDRDIPALCPRTPDGWSKSNLYTLQPTKAQRALKTRGLAAAKAHLLSIQRDPSRLLPLQLIAIDDFEADQLCVVRGHRQLCKMIGVAAMDVATRRIVGLVFKPRLTDDAGKQQAITRAEVRLLLFQLLREHGVPAHGMTILCEKAAAAVTAEVETTFRNLFDGRVAVTRTTTLDGSVLSGGFRETGGKPWLKGWIESFFNLLHNVAGDLPGQKGASYQLKPADLEEKMRITRRLIGTGPQDARLSDEQLERAVLPFLSPEEMTDAYLKIFRWIEDRTDHELLGFDQVQEWRAHESEAPRPLRELATLSREEQLAVEILPPRMESPRERWAKLYPKIQRAAVADHVLMMLLLTPRKAARKSYKLTFAHNAMGYTYAIEPRSLLDQATRDGEEVLVYFDPAAPGTAHVARVDGRYLGDVRRWGAVDIANPAEVTEAERELARLYAEIRATVAERPLHQLESAQLQQAAGINEALAAEAAAERAALEAPKARGLTATLARQVLPPSAAGAVSARGEDLARGVVAAKAEQDACKARDKALRKAGDASADLLGDDATTLHAAPAAPALSAEDLLD